MEKQNLNELIIKAKKNNQSRVLQKTVPIPIKEIEEVQFSFYLEKKLLKKLKLQALEDETSLKEIINKALENYLKTN
jgi:hypothetical protein